jgi:DNA repair exonuclease SbcCD nuclease subunit
MSKANVIAILTSDFHLCHKTPICRSRKPDWYEVMAEYLGQLNLIQEKYNCPIIFAGDLFDRWNSPPELINFAIEYLPDNMYCIPGQHDLPLHNLEDIEKSAYWTLVAAKKIKHMNRGEVYTIKGKSEICIHPFPFGANLAPLNSETRVSTTIYLLVAHKYIWKKNYSYPGASLKDKVSNFAKILSTYDVAHFGDNHNGFIAEGFKPSYVSFNSGTLIRRKVDEINYSPMVGLLYDNDEVITHTLDTQIDQFDDNLISKLNDVKTDMTEFFMSLESATTDTMDFKEVLDNYLKTNQEKIDKAVRDIIVEALEECYSDE